MLLMHDVLNSGGEIVATPFPLCHHTDESSGQTMNAQGAVHKKVFGNPTWWGLIAAFAWKRLKEGQPSRILDYLRGGAWASRHA